MDFLEITKAQYVGGHRLHLWFNNNVDKGHTAWVIENDSAVRKEIIIGGYEADGVRIETGLQAGDTLIIDGYQKLYNGCKVIVD